VTEAEVRDALRKLGAKSGSRVTFDDFKRL
jgi:hypothetical protein